MRGWAEMEGSSLTKAGLKTCSRRGHEAEHSEFRSDSASRRRIRTETLSASARERILSLPGEPLFLANWERTLMIHFEVEAMALQKVVPFELDLRDGRAFVSVVAFRMSRMRPRFGGRIAAWVLKPIATHDFLNVRTYVRGNGEAGIRFMAEWLSNRLSVMLGPRAFGLPYRFGKIDYNHDWESSSSSNPFVAPLYNACLLTGRVADPKTRDAFIYDATLKAGSHFSACQLGSLSEWLMERYTAFTSFGAKRRFFRVWHEPWSQVGVDIRVAERSLLEGIWPFFRNARLVGANFSPGVTGVWMGWPHRVRG